MTYSLVILLFFISAILLVVGGLHSLQTGTAGESQVDPRNRQSNFSLAT